MNRQEYKRQLTILNAKPPKADHPDQKFPRGTLVYSDDIWEGYGGQGEGKPTLCVIQYTYAQKFYGGKRERKEYSVIILDDKMNPINSLAWQHEKQLRLTKAGKDTKLGLKLINVWKESRDK